MELFDKFTSLSMLMICWFLIPSSTNDDRIVIITNMIKMDFVWFLHITLQNYNSMLDKMLLTLSPVATSSALSYLTNRVLLISVHQAVMSVRLSIYLHVCMSGTWSVMLSLCPSIRWAIRLTTKFAACFSDWCWAMVNTTVHPSVHTTVFVVVVVFGVIISDWFC